MKTYRATITGISFTETWTQNGGLRKVAHATLDDGRTISGRPGGSVNFAVHAGIRGEFEITEARDGSWYGIED
jgi:hypothetical protein